MSRYIGWVGMALTFSGVAIQSLFPADIRYSFLLFLVSASVWFTNGLITRNRALAVTQAGLFVLNVIALIHWF